MTATDTIAKLIAQGLLTREEVLPDIIAAAHQAAPHQDRSGVQARATWALDDAIRNAHLFRSATAAAIRRAVHSLAEQRAPREQILRSAADINRRADSPLLTYEVREEAREAVAWWLNRNAPAHAQRRRG